MKRARRLALSIVGVALFLLSPLPVFVLLNLILNGLPTPADVEFMRIGAIGAVIMAVLVACAVEISDPIGSWREARKKRRNLTVRAVLRGRRQRARAIGLPDPAVERGHVLAASMRPKDRLQVRRFAIRRIKKRLRNRSGRLPVYAVIGAATFVTTLLPVAGLFGVGVSTLLIAGLIVAGGATIGVHMKDSRAQTSGDPLLLIGTIVETNSSTSAKSLAADSASSSVHKVRLRVRGAQSLCADGSLGPVPEGCHGLVSLASSADANKRVEIGEHVAIVSAGGHLIGRLEDAFASASTD